MKRYSFYLPLLLAVALAGCKDPTNDSVTSGSTIGTTISDSTHQFGRFHRAMGRLHLGRNESHYPDLVVLFRQH